MRIFNLLAPALLTGLLTAPAAAQQSERYVIERTEKGYVRMDTGTGEMSVCEERSGQLVCKAAADERAAFQDEIDRLEAEIAALEGRIAALEGARSALPNADTPSEEEFEKALGFMERFFRRFMDIVKDLEKDFGKPEPQTDRT